MREDYKRLYNRALHIAPLGFANLVEFLQWGVYSQVVVVDQAMQKGEKGWVGVALGRSMHGVQLVLGMPGPCSCSRRLPRRVRLA